jgi:glutathione S-transferase
MYRLHGQNTRFRRFIENILTTKGMKFEVTNECHPCQEAPVLEDRDLFLTHPTIIIDYLESKHPFPQLLPAELAQRAATLELCCQINDGEIPTEKLTAYLNHRRPFVLGSRISILDLAIEPLVQNAAYTGDIYEHAKGVVF